MAISKKISLNKLFWKFIVYMIVGISLSVIIPFCILIIAVNTNTVTFANYSEQQTKSIIPIIKSAPDISDVNLPIGTKYLLLDKSFKCIKTNMNDEEYNKAIIYSKTGQVELGGKRQFVFVERDNEYVVLQYYIGSHYKNDWLNSNFISPETLIIVAVIINCLAFSTFITTYFSKKIKKELVPLVDATKEIEKQNLDFNISQSKISEFDDVLKSFDNMRNNLKDSLEKQWLSEQVQKEQIAAMAHDLKTPLTVIQGNIDLILETDISEKTKQYAEYALKSSEQMRDYIKILLEISKSSIEYKINKKEIKFKTFMEHIIRQTKIICKEKQIDIIEEFVAVPEKIFGDEVMLERAIMNILINAYEYSEYNSSIYIKVYCDEKYLYILTDDSGKGFSEEDILHAKELFYMADKSRNTDCHFGMGLYIANSIISKHNGNIILKNSEKTNGGRVIVRMNLSDK